MTYGELDRRSNALAWVLRRRRLSTETPVGVAIERRPDLVVALLAVLKAGGAYLPIELGTPGPRITAMINAANARLVLVTTGSAAAIPALPGVDTIHIGHHPPIANPLPPPTNTRHHRRLRIR
jgi:non-ribosomal peptide synthetase component F